jgi:hypothetical protein
MTDSKALAMRLPSCSFVLVLAVPIVAIALACGGATASDVGSSGGGDASGGSSGGGSSGGGGQGGGQGGGSSGGAADGGIDGSSLGRACGEVAGGATCGAGEWCNRGEGVCAGKGVCETLPPSPPPSCPAYPAMLCGCNGTAYCSVDDAHASGVEIAVEGSCTFGCGPSTCDALTQFCDHGSGGVALPDGGTNQRWECKTLPAACAQDRSCTCVQADPSSKGELCNVSDGHVQVEHLYP